MRKRGRRQAETANGSMIGGSSGAKPPDVMYTFGFFLFLTYQSRRVKLVNGCRHTRWFAGLLSLVIACSAAPHAGQQDPEVSILRSDNQSIVFEYRPEYLPPVRISASGGEFLLYDFARSVPSQGSEGVGGPDIRMRAFALGFPGERGNTVRVVAADYEDIPSVPLVPIPMMRGGEGDLPEIVAYEADPAKYGRNALLPAVVAELASVSQVRSMLIGTIRVHPLQYNPVTRSLRRYSRIVLEVQYGLPRRDRAQTNDDQLFRGTLINYDVAREWRFAPPRRLAKMPVPSVLASGDWYKISVLQEGMYILTQQFLAAAGVNLTGVDPRTIKIYGNGGAEVPENVSAPRPSDLVEDAIIVGGEADGSFDGSDYVLFYARGVRGLSYDSGSRSLRHYINRYSEVNYYWLTFGGPPGKRVQDQVSLTTSPLVVPDRFQDAIAIEEEKSNLLRSGKDWYGQRLNPGESFTYVNALPGLAPGDIIRYRYSLIARSDAPPTYDVRENGVLIGSDHRLGPVNISGSDFTYATQGTFAATYGSALPGNTSQLNFTFKSSGSGASGWIDWIEIQFPRLFWANSNYLRFRSPDTSGVVEYHLEQFTETPFILNVTRPEEVTRITGTAGNYIFRAQEIAGQISEYCAASPSTFKQPAGFTRVSNQDLHGQSPGAEFIIITSPEFQSAAERLKTYREQPAHGNLRTVVVPVEQIYNEFGGGIPDIGAIRDFLKYTYENWQPTPVYVLLFGAASYDYKGILGSRTSFVPTWQSVESRNDVNSYATDDFFSEFSGTSRPSLVLGRINCRDLTEANVAVDKLMRYEENSVRDGWKVRMLFVGDDGWTSEVGDAEGTIHSEQAESIAEGYYSPTQRYTPEEFERRKIYIAEYPTVNTAQGRRKPGAYQAIIDDINEGALVVNFAGHGNPRVWTHERVFDVLTSIPQLVNADKLSMFFLATCNFSQYDDPTERSGAELLMHKVDGGAISVVSASRKVYQPNNAYLHRQVFEKLFLQDTYGRVLVRRPAEALYLYKATVQNDANDQKFFYMGDPSMFLQYPSGFASIDSINQQPLGTGTTPPVELKALSKVTLTGTVRDANNGIDSSFSGRVLLAVNDASRKITIVNFAPGINWTYLGPGGTIYRGENSVANGHFVATFVIPKDISYADTSARGRIEAYYTTSSGDGLGYTGNVRIGGTDTTGASDNEGPEIALYVDSRSFRAGDPVRSSPTLYVDLKDDHGINTSTSGIGHRIEIWLNNSSKSEDVTNYYSSALNDYQQGTVQYQLKDLPLGRNTLRARAWDTYNNASTADTYFDVTFGDQLRISEIMNYPNPFADATSFTFRQNQLAPLDVTVKVYTLAGRMIQSLEDVVSGEPFIRIPWDGRDRDGDILANGVYLYKVIVRTTDGRFSSEALGKLSVLR
jgi:hypothetical protein